tara:strand:+ start:279 stop:632 length:354 start_codon:yes stop_codon:yes gene_type:complete
MKDPTWKLLGGYLLILFLLICSANVSGQIVVTHYNADWNKANKVEWVDKLTDCTIKYIDIAESPTVQKKQEIVVVPTIVIYKDGVEIKRYQADISFTMKATRKELQEYIDELIMSDF